MVLTRANRKRSKGRKKKRKATKRPVVKDTKVGGRRFLGYAEGKTEKGRSVSVPLFLRNEIHYEEPKNTRTWKSLPVSRSAASWAYGPERDVIKKIVNPECWKCQTRMVRVRGLDVAERIAGILAKSMGGAEIVDVKDGTYVVKSRGYYHYIGA